MNNSKIHMKVQKTLNSQNNPNKNSDMEDIKIHGYKLYLRALLTKAV